MAASISGCFGQERPGARNTVALRFNSLVRSASQLSVEQSWVLSVARRSRSAASTQTVASGAKMLMFPQTSSSSSCAISESLSRRNRLDSSAGISSAAASRSAGLQERTLFRCSSKSSRIVNLPSSPRRKGSPSAASLRGLRRNESYPRTRRCSVLAFSVCHISPPAPLL